MSELVVDSTRLPTAVEVNAQFVLTTETTISPSYNGFETLYAKRRPRVEAMITFGPEYADDIIALYRSQIGPKYAFTVRDWSDYQIADQVLAPLTDGTYPIVKTYGNVVRSAERRIVLPDPTTIEVDIDGVPSVSGDWTLLDNGIIQPNIDFSGSQITITCEFFIPMRFAEDQLTLTMPASFTRVSTMKLIEMLPDL